MDVVNLNGVDYKANKNYILDPSARTIRKVSLLENTVEFLKA